ncbi:MAG TPA: PKD domain-containing protein, partial [Nocardioidaceae bacterium]
MQAHEPGDYLIGQRWAAPATGPQTLTVVAQRNLDWTTMTLLDFDRDGRPDAMVNFAWSPGQQDVVWQLWRLTPAAMAPGIGTTGGLPCFTPTPDDATLVGAGHIPEVRRTFTWEVTLTHDFGADLGSAYAGLVRYQPIITTIFTPSARALFSAYTVNDILPNSADPVQAEGDTAHQCSGKVNGTFSEGIQVAPARGTDRGQSTFLPARRQAMFTDATTTDTGQPQLVESDIEQWNASQTTDDLTADVPNPTPQTYHPADLVLTMRADHPLDTVTYLVPDGGKQPIGLVSTSGVANQPAGQATLHVQLASGLSSLSYPNSATGNGCYPRSASTIINGHAWGPTPVSFDVPLTAVTGDNGQSEYRAEISLDDVLGIGDGGTGDRPAFRWATTSAPGLHFPPQYTPDVAGLDDIDQPFGVCTVPTTGDPDGTQLWPSSMVRMDTTLPSASLASSPSNPHAGDTVTLTATTDATSPSYRFDPESTGSWGSFGASASTTHAYGSTVGGQPFVAHVYLVNGAGTGAMASTTVATDDPPPTASFSESSGSPAPPFVIGTNGPTISWTDQSTDTLGGVIKAWHWDLHKTTWNGTGGTSCDATATDSSDPSCDAAGFSHTFVTGDQGDWVLTETVTDDGGAKSSMFKTFHVVQPPIALLDSVTPQPIVINLNTFPVEGDFTIHMKTADDGSLGSEGPLTYFFAGASGTLATPPFGANDFFQGSDPFDGTFDGKEFRTGVFPVQAEVEDTDGRTDYTPVFNVLVRGAGDSPPTAHLTTSPGTIRSGETDVTFDASASVLNNPDGSTGVPDHFQFDFGDGTPPLDTTSAVVHHTYAGSGQYTASVTVIDDRILPATPSDPATANLTVAPGTTDTSAPVAKLALVHPDQPVFAKAPVELTAAASTVHAGDGPAHFAWDLDGDGTFETDTGTNATLNTTYPTAGVRHVKVRVTDARGRASVSNDLFVGVNPPNDQPPFVQVTGPDTITLANGSGQATFDASNSVGRNLDGSLTFAWDLNGDGTYETFTGSVSHVTATFTSSGVHTVRVRATDIYGNSDVASTTIFVRGAAEVAAGCQSKEQYRTLSYGKIQLAACWSQVDRPGTAPLWVARNNVLVDGMLLNSPTAGSADQQTFSNCTGSCATTQSAFNLHHGSMIAFDPTNGLLATNMPFAWRATNGVESFVLNQGSLDLMLPTSSDADGLILHPPSGGTFLTLSVASQAEVKFPDDGEATIALTMHMPPQLPGASGDLTLRSTTTQGLIVDHLAVDVTTGLLADKLKLSDLSLEYDRPTQLWSGSAELGIPGIKKKPDFGLKVGVSVQNGKFHSIYGEVNGLEIDLGEGIFLQRIAAGVGVDPIDIQGGLGISAGPEILGTQILSADGDFRLTLPSAAAPYTLFQIAGVTKLADLFDLTKGVARFTTDGFVEARGGLTRESFIGYFDASIGGWFTLHD